MSSHDLLERARSAVTVEEECAVIWEAIQRAINEPGGRHPLSVIVGSVRAGHAPRPVLLGVVAALVPEGVEAYVTRIRTGRGKACVSANDTPSGLLIPAYASPALALLIAILEASNAHPQ